MVNKEKLKIIEEIVSQSKFIHLGTIDEKGYSNVRMMLNLRNYIMFPQLSKKIEDLNEAFVIYCSTNTASTKIKQIKINPKASIYYSVTKDRWAGVSFIGFIEIVEDMKLKSTIWKDDWKQYYPKGYADPDCTLLRFKPKQLKYYENLSGFTHDFK